MGGCTLGFMEALSLLSYLMLKTRIDERFRGTSNVNMCYLTYQRVCPCVCVCFCVSCCRVSLSDARWNDQLLTLHHVLQLAQVAHVVDLPAELEAAHKQGIGESSSCL